MTILRKISFGLFISLLLPVLAHASQTCLNQVEHIESHFNGLKALPLGVDGQIQIDKKASGLERFTRVDQTLLVDAERVPLLSEKRKEFYPFNDSRGHIQGIHISVKTYREIHTGVEIFNAEIADESESSTKKTKLLLGPNNPHYFKDFKLERTPYSRDSIEGLNWLLSHGDDRSNRWSHHSFLYGQIGELTDETYLKLFFETDFDNHVGAYDVFPNFQPFIRNWISNSTSGSRIDTCVYFLIEED